MGVLRTFATSVTVVNRTIGGGKYEVPLNVRYDGEDIVIHPGENPGFPAEAVGYAKRQNPLMGSRHPMNPARFISLVGVKGQDDCSPIPEEVLKKAAAALEAVDRDGEFWGEALDRTSDKVKLLRKNPFSAYEAQVTMPFDGYVSGAEAPEVG